MANDNIFAQYLRPPKSIAEYSAELDEADARRQTLKQNALALAAGQQKLDDYRTTQQRSNKLMETLAGFAPGTSAAERAGTLERGGYLKEAQDLAESDMKVGRDRAAAEKDHLAAVKERWGILNNAIAGSVDQPSYSQNRAALAALGIDVSGIPEQFDPAFLANAKQQALSEMQRADQLWKQKGFDLDVQKADEIKRNNIVQTNLAARGQNMVDARAREATAGAMSKPFEVTGPDGNPVLVRQDRKGNIAPVEGYSAKPLKPLAPGVVKSVTEARDNAVTMDRLNTSFKDDFGGKGIFGLGADASMAVKGNVGTDKDSVAWWKDYKKNAELVERHAMFGASLTPGEQASWRSADIAPGMDPAVIKENLITRAALAKKVAASTAQDQIDAGHSETRVRAIASRGEGKPGLPAAGAYSDAEKERRYQEWKAKQGQK